MSDRGRATGEARAAGRREPGASRRAWIVAAFATVLGLGALVAAAAAQTRTPTTQTRPQDTAPRAPAASPTVPVPTEVDAAIRARYVSPELLEAAIDPDSYVLGPGDLLAVMLLVGEMRIEQLPVLPEGVVVIPNVGAVPAAGKTLAEFREALRTALARNYRNFELYCYLARPRQFRVYVTGEVATPGVLAVRATERVSDVIDRAGGFTDFASRRDIELLDAEGRLVGRIDLVGFLARGDLRANPPVQSGQVVRVPPLGRQADIRGEVRDPGTLEVRRGETVGELLELAGGPTAMADLSRVTVESTDSTGAVRIHSYDLRSEAPLADDVTRVTVMSTMLGQRRAFFIAPDDRQQTFYIGDGEKLSDLVLRIANLPPDADLSAAQLATRDADGKAIQVDVDIERVLAGEQDRPLEDGDVLSVPSVKGYIYVSGFVSRPGRYVYRAEWTVNDYLGEAGGPAQGGSRNAVSLITSDGKQRKADRSTPVHRGETLYVDRSAGSKSVNALSVLINVTALALSVVALTR